MSLAAALALAAAAASQSAAQALAALPSSGVSVTVTASARILEPAVVTLDEDKAPPAESKDAKVALYRERNTDGSRILIEFN